MLTIIHGDDIVASRNCFADLKQKHADAPSFDGTAVSLTDLAQIFEGGGLFEDSKTVFIEQLFTKKSRGGRSKTKSPSELDAILAYIRNHASLHTIVLWENKEIDRSALLEFKSAEVKNFKLPQTLFLLLDSIKPNNGKQLISLFHQTIVNSDPEMIFFMLVRQIRLLLALSSSTPSGQMIDEIKRMQPWQKTKMQKQAALFSQEKLVQLYHSFFSLEVGQKTGSLSMSVTSAIDFLLLEI